jgi:hypothetical protein
VERSRTGNRGHSSKIYPQQAKASARKNSFALRITNIWNNLPAHVVQAKTVNSFKNKLDKFWSKQELMYDDFKAKIKITASDESKYNSHESDVEEP